LKIGFTSNSELEKRSSEFIDERRMSELEREFQNRLEWSRRSFHPFPWSRLQTRSFRNQRNYVRDLGDPGFHRKLVL